MEFLTEHEIEIYTQKVVKPKQKLIIDGLLYTGLRVSELINLKWKDINFQDKKIIVKSLKKREKEEFREVPLHDNLVITFSNYLKTKANIDANDYVFESPSKKGQPIHRVTVNELLKSIAKKHNIQPAYPHKFRHTFATNLRRTGAELHTISNLLGHENYTTTMVYAHITQEEGTTALNNAYKKTFYQKVKEKLGFGDKVPIINLMNEKNLVGRKDEILLLNENLSRGISSMLIGAKGIGKSLILDNIQAEKIIRLDDLKGLKKILKDIILHLANEGKEQELTLLLNGLDSTKIQKESIRELTRIITTVTQEKEFIITIDSIDNLTQREAKFLEELSNHFTVVCATRQLKLNVSETATNFKVIQIQELKRAEAFELTNILIQKYNLQCENYELLRTHIVEESRCVPERIEILIQRFSSEPFITEDAIRVEKLVDVTKEFDATFVIVLVVSAFAVLRYLSAEVNNSSYKFLGGIAMIVLLFSRSIFTRTRKKTSF
jgi:hypothetical protein